MFLNKNKLKSLKVMKSKDNDGRAVDGAVDAGDVNGACDNVCDGVCDGVCYNCKSLSPYCTALP